MLWFFAGGVFLVNFDFSAPKVPRVTTLPFFWVLVVTEKIKIFSKILAGCARTVLLYVKEKIKNHLKFAALHKIALIRFGFMFVISLINKKTIPII